MKVIIPMAGAGNRFVAAGYTVPKPIICVDGFPIIEHILRLYKKDDEFVFICNEDHLILTEMRNVIARTAKKMQLKYDIITIPSHKKGPIETVRHAYDKILDDEEVIVNYCDFTVLWNYEDFLRFKEITSADGVVIAYRGFHPHMLGSDNYAFMRDDRQMKMLEIKEKESFTDDKISEPASSGTYYFRTGEMLKRYFDEVLEKDINVEGEYYVSLVYNLMVRDNLRVFIHEADNMFQWGTPEDIENYQSWSDYFASRDFQSNKYFEDPCHLDNNISLILPMAGRGSRYQNNKISTPKPLLSVEGKPMFIEAIKCLPKCKKTVLVCLQEHLDHSDVYDMATKEGIDPCEIVGIPSVTEGQACTTEKGILASKISIDDPIMVTACDNSSSYDLESYKTLLANDKIDVIVWSFRGDDTSKNNPNMYSWLKVDDNMNLLSAHVKDCIFDDPFRNHAIIGTMFFRKARYFKKALKSLYEKNTRTNNEFYIDNLLNEMLKDNLRIKVFEVEKYVCWGTPQDLRIFEYWKNLFSRCKWHTLHNSD